MAIRNWKDIPLFKDVTDEQGMTGTGRFLTDYPLLRTLRRSLI